jgi:hypothetical protein
MIELLTKSPQKHFNPFLLWNAEHEKSPCHHK